MQDVFNENVILKAQYIELVEYAHATVFNVETEIRFYPKIISAATDMM